jgi:sugar O-acyltransferase (sialic acid O-acetyltransferase NeuD family)
MKEVYGIFGAGGYGREVMPLARAQLHNKNKPSENLLFVTDNPEINEVNGVEVTSLKDFLNLNANSKYMSCAIADGKVRSLLKNRTQDCDIIDWTVMAENCVVMDNVEIGKGSILSPFVTITSNVTIGLSFHANLYSYVGHDCTIGDFVTFAPGVKCNGNIVIENHVYIGTGAIIKPGRSDNPLTIGEAAVIGIGSVITKDVPPGVTVFGNPAKIIRRPK